VSASFGSFLGICCLKNKREQKRSNLYSNLSVDVDTVVAIQHTTGKASQYNVFISNKHECLCLRMPSHAALNPPQIEVSRAIGGSLCVYNLSLIFGKGRISWCCLFYLCIEIWLDQQAWNEVKELNIFITNGPRDKREQLVFFPLCKSVSAEGTWLSFRVGLVLVGVVVIVTPDCSQRP